MRAFTYMALLKNREALPRLLALLPEPQRSQAAAIAADAQSLTPDDLAARIAELRAADLANIGFKPAADTWDRPSLFVACLNARRASVTSTQEALNEPR